MIHGYHYYVCTIATTPFCKLQRGIMSMYMYLNMGK